MKVLRVISSINPQGGGPIEGVKQLQAPLSELGVDVEIACCDAPEEPWLTTSRLPIVHALGPTRMGYGYTPNLLPWLRANVQRFDAVIVNGIWQYHSFAAHRALAGGNVPYFVFTHGMLDPWFKRVYPLKHVKKCLYWPWEYAVLRDAAGVLFTCEEERLLARKSFWPNRWNERVVNYGTAGHVGDAVRQREIFLNAHPQLRGKRCLLFLSRIHPKKGIDLLIEAFARVCCDKTDWHLVIAGPDQVGWQPRLQSLAHRLGVDDRITWTGMLGGDMKWGAYINAEAFVLPSHQENFGIVVAEALSCGVPVLISDKVNIWREIAMDRAGLVAPDDLDGCVELLQQWGQSDDANKALMKDSALECFKNRFEVGLAAKSLLGALSGM